MRAAILTDIHGNLLALEAVLADVARQSPDLVILGGDLAANGPRPAQVIDRLAELGCPGVMGNMDDSVLHTDWPASAWAREQLGPKRLEYLAGLALSHRVTPPGGVSPRDDLLVVHSTPRSCDDLLLLALPPVDNSFPGVTSPDEARAMLAGAQANLIVYGHIHFFSQGQVSGQRLASVGAVGFPFDGDPRAAYALLEWDGQNWQVEPVRVEYDYESTAAQIEQSGQPLSRRYAAMLRQSRWLDPNIFKEMTRWTQARRA